MRLDHLSEGTLDPTWTSSTQRARCRAAPVQVQPPDMQLLGVVVDRSGSMASMRSELVEGLNAFVEAQRKVGPAKSQ